MTMTDTDTPTTDAAGAGSPPTPPPSTPIATEGDVPSTPTPPTPRAFRTSRTPADAPRIPFDIVIETTEDVLDADDVPTGETRDVEIVEKFHAVPSVTGDVLLDVAAAMTQDGSWQALAIRRLFDAAIHDDEKARWKTTLAHKDGPDLTTLAEIADWLCGEYGERPTGSA